MSSPRVCYLERTDRGVRLRRARLVGLRSEDAWSPSPDVGAEDAAAGARQQVASLAGWLRERLSQGRGGGSLDALCVDADAGVCSWLASPAFDPVVVSALIRQRTAPGMQGDSGQASSLATVATVLGDQGETDLQPLASLERATRRGAKERSDAGSARVPVLAVPDTTVRLLVDELDRLGVRVHTSLSIWHAAAAAWHERAGQPADRRVVADSSATRAILLVDPDAARLVWAWSRDGLLLAAGSMLLPATGSGAGVRPVVTEDQAARLASEFLSWSVQTGAAPSRVVVVTPELGAEGLSPAALGEALSRGWPGAGVDLAIDDDPVGLTLRRLAERADAEAMEADDPRAAIVALTGRPGRTHRAMYRWLAGAIVAAAACVAVTAWRLGASADDLRETAKEARQRGRDAVAEVRPELANSPFMAQELETEVELVRRRTLPPDAFQPAKPILPELETLTLVLAQPHVSLEDISLGTNNAVVSFFVPETSAAEEIDEAMKTIEGSQIAWRMEWQTLAGQGDRRIRCTLSGPWIRPAAAPGGTGP